MKIAAKFIMAFSLLSLASIEPTFAAGDANRSTQSPSSEKPKKEDNSKPTTAASEVQPSTAARPVESKAAEIKPTTEAKPVESRATKESDGSDKSNSNSKKPDNEKKSPKAEIKNNGKSEAKSDSKSKSPNPKSNSNSEREGTKESKGVGHDKKADANETDSPLPSPTASPKNSSIQTQSSPAQTLPTQTPDEHFVRIEKSDGNKATLIVSGPKIGSKIKITITSKGSKK